MSDSFETPWTVACQAPLSMGFPRREYWRGLPFPSPGDLPDPGTEPESPALAGGVFITEPPEMPPVFSNSWLNLSWPSFILPSLLSIFVISTLNYILGRLLVSTSLSSSLSFCFIPVFRTHFSISSFTLVLRAYFYVICMSVTIPDFVEMVLCRRCPVRFRSTHPSGHRSYMLQGCPCVHCVGPSAVVGLWVHLLAVRPYVMW